MKAILNPFFIQNFENPLQVTCAIIEDNGRVLCAQRSESMKHPLKWEFPGGKVEGDESLEVCLKREIKEELGVEIEIMEELPANRHCYYAKNEIELIPFRCRLISFELEPREHAQLKWLAPNELKELDWVEADVPIVENYINTY